MIQYRKPNPLLYGSLTVVAAIVSGACGGNCRHPRSVLFDQDIGQHDEISHDCGQGHLGGFAFFAQVLLLARQVWIVPNDTEGCHVEYSARSCPAAADKTLSLPLSRLPGHRGQSGEAGDGLAVDLSEFGQFSDQAGGGNGGDAGDGGEYSGFLLQFGIRVDPFLDGTVDVTELSFDLCQALFTVV